MKKAMVTGGFGFLGSAVVRELIKRNYQVFILDRSGTQNLCNKKFDKKVIHISGSILDYKFLKKTFKNIDVIYHMAGKLGTGELNSQKIESVEANIIGSLNVINAAIENNVPKIFLPSKPNVWLNTYTITKETIDNFVSLYNTEKKIEIYSLRYFNAYGCEQHLFPIRKIIPYFALRSIQGLPIEIFGNGKQTVDMIFSKDLAKITVDFTESKFSGKIIDCGTGVAKTVNQIAKDVNEYFGCKSKIIHAKMRDGEYPNTKLVANIKPLKKILGKIKYTDWKSSLSETLKYYSNLSKKEISKANNFYK